MEPVIKQGIGGSISVYHWVDEAKTPGAELSAAQAQAFAPGGGALTPQTSITPATDGAMTLTLTAEQSGSAYEWCRARFQYVYGGETQVQDVYFHIARSAFDIPLHFDELVKFQPDIGDYAFSGDATFHRQRDTALMEIYAHLINAGRRPWRILNRSMLNVTLARLWLAHIFAALSNRPNDEWDERSRQARTAFEESFSRLNLIERDGDSADVAGLPGEPMAETRIRRA